MKNAFRHKILYLLLLSLSGWSLKAQQEGFMLTTENDSLHYVIYRSSEGVDRWKIPYPVYQFHVGDIDNNGIDEALVGVIKQTRFFPLGRRIFIFKVFRNKVRPLWMGSRIGDPLLDFRIVEVEGRHLLRCLGQSETTQPLYTVADFCTKKFGVQFVRYRAKEVSYDQALQAFKAND